MIFLILRAIIMPSGGADKKYAILCYNSPIHLKTGGLYVARPLRLVLRECHRHSRLCPGDISLFSATYVALIRHHRNALAIFLVNLFLGGTGVGWLVALIWAFAG
jgi:hypothetical protein